MQTVTGHKPSLVHIQTYIQNQLNITLNTEMLEAMKSKEHTQNLQVLHKTTIINQ